MRAVNDVVDGNDTLRSGKEWIQANPQKAAIGAVIAVAVIVAIIIIIIVYSRSSNSSGEGGGGVASPSLSSSSMPNSSFTLSPSRTYSYNSTSVSSSSSPTLRTSNISYNASAPLYSPSMLTPSPAASGGSNSSTSCFTHDYYNVCNGRGMMFPDSNNTCECFMDCFRGANCEQVSSNCSVYTKSEQSLGLFADYWVSLNSKGGSANGGLDPLIIAAEYRLPYQDDMRILSSTTANGLSRSLLNQITKLHQTYGNSNTAGKSIILGTSRNGLLQAALYAMYKQSGQVVSLFSRTPYHRDYPHLCTYTPGMCMWASNTSTLNSSSSQILFEIISKPQNPTGQRPTLGQVYPNNNYWGYDLGDYWPSIAGYGGPLLTSDAPIQFFSMSKLSGHGSGRFAWAVIDNAKMPGLRDSMRDYISNIQIHLGLETATRANQILTFLNSNPSIFNTTKSVIDKRWVDIITLFNSSAVASAGWQLNSAVGSQYLWIQCPSSFAETDCTSAFEGNKIFGYPGRDFGVTSTPYYYRLSITVRQVVYPYLMQNLAKAVGGTYTPPAR